MAIKKPTKLLLFLAFFSGQLLAQDCLEYPEIEGPECAICAPPGWVISSSTPDIISDDGTWPAGTCEINDISGTSPTGGNMVLLVAGATGYESISTTFSGLNTGQEYGFGIYWEEVTIANCVTTVPGLLTVIIDGEEYSFDGEEDWAFVEICFTPSQSSIEIEVLNGSNEIASSIVVDSADCEELTPCCPLLVMVEEQEFEICTGEEFLIEGTIDNSEGDITIEWTSEPSDGIDFLSSSNSLSPTFSFPEGDNFEGETYEFTVAVEDDNCTIELIIEVIVNSSEIPEFDISICELEYSDPFPIESENGYLGSWSGNFDFADIVGTVQEYTFTLNSGQDNCIQEYVYNIPIEPANELTFEINNSYCVLDDDDYELPDESEEDIEGEWDEDDFNPYELGVGVFNFIFQPDPEFCAFPFTAEIEVFEESFLSFDIPDTFCISNQNFVLPNPSLEGIFGSWETDQIDLSTPEINQRITFTPEDVNDCFQEYTHIYSVIESINTTFNIPDTICRTNEVLVFDSTSIEGITGAWKPLAVNSDTIIGDQFSIEWTPLDASSDCLQGNIKTITIINPRVLDITLPESICRDHGEFTLPLSDTNGTLVGNWNIPIFDPDTITSSSINLVFTHLENECAELYSASINIVDNNDPVFGFQTEFCSSNSDLTLPLIDENGIEGTWTIPVIQPSLISGQVSSVFTPNDLLNCYNSYEATFTVNNLITPQFDLPIAFCANETEFIFPELSLNSTQGSWSEAIFNPAVFGGTEFTNTFIPDDTSCNETIAIVIPVVNFNSIQNSVFNASSCSANDGVISFTEVNEFELSIDNGITWQSDPSFENLGSGNYQITVRHNVFNDCIQFYDIQITAPSAPVILMLETMNISDCGFSDGTVTCVAEGSDLEYSIDNGNTWQLNNIFADLSIGNYTVLVRSDGDSNCSTQQDFEINDIANVLIDDLIVINISDCNIDDGQVTILPNANIYEYSIDGLTWQTSNAFNNLVQGNFTASIRLTISPNCFDSQSFEINSPVNPSILNIHSENPSDCNIDDGSITINASGIQLEYSIDNGNSWTNDNVFSDLPSGIFNIIVREKDSPNCVVESSVTLETPNTPQITNFEIINPSDCISNNGSIEVITSFSDVEFSIDNGANWQNDGSFENLQPDNYTLVVRNTSSIDCTTSLQFEISKTLCPCNTLGIEITSVDANCFNASSGSIEITSISGFYTNEDYEIQWSNGESDVMLENLTEGWYSYEILYDQNCSLIDSIFLDAFDPISFGLLAFDPNCKESGSIEVMDIEGGNGQLQFSLDGINFQDNNVFFNLSADEYQVILEDNFNCFESDNVTLNTNYDLSLDIPIIQPINLGDITTLNPLINQATIDSFEWSPTLGIINSNELIAQVSPQETTEYTLTIYFGDCVETRTVNVEVIDNTDLYLGNTFSPNFGGSNDYFFIQSSMQNNFLVSAFKIYDRWGNLVFNKSNPEINNKKDGWDGTRNGESLSSGVYTYIIIYNKNERREILSGHLTLVK